MQRRIETHLMAAVQGLPYEKVLQVKDQLDQSNAVTVATYEYSGADDGKPNAIRFTYGSGNGHVLLIGSHPESRSGSNEDWIYWDNWKPDSTTPLNNPDNPWTFIDAAFDNWLIQP